MIEQRLALLTTGLLGAAMLAGCAGDPAATTRSAGPAPSAQVPRSEPATPPAPVVPQPSEATAKAPESVAT